MLSPPCQPCVATVIALGSTTWVDTVTLQVGKNHIGDVLLLQIVTIRPRYHVVFEPKFIDLTVEKISDSRTICLGHVLPLTQPCHNISTTNRNVTWRYHHWSSGSVRS